MYKSDNLFEPPTNDVVIWHYMDFMKFISLLETNCLFFRRASKLKDVDPREGYYSMPDLQLIEDKKWQMANKALILKSCEGKVLDINEQELDKLAKKRKEQLDLLANETREEFNKSMGINCWHISEFESMAMWKLYGESIALKSSFNRLKDSLKDNYTSSYIGKIKYKDYFKESITENKEKFIDSLDICGERHFLNSRDETIITFWQFFIPLLLHKRNCFSYENELRIITPIYDNLPCGMVTDGGIKVPINLEILIEEIIISPRVEDWLTELVTSIIKKFKPDWAIKADKSTLLEEIK